MIQRVDPRAKLLPVRFQMAGNQFPPSLFISDYDWWQQNVYEILEWMDKYLPRGREHHRGMVIEFVNDGDRLNFLARWR